MMHLRCVTNIILIHIRVRRPLLCQELGQILIQLCCPDWVHLVTVLVMHHQDRPMIRIMVDCSTCTRTSVTQLVAIWNSVWLRDYRLVGPTTNTIISSCMSTTRSYVLVLLGSMQWADLEWWAWLRAPVLMLVVSARERRCRIWALRLGLLVVFMSPIRRVIMRVVSAGSYRGRPLVISARILGPCDWAMLTICSSSSLRWGTFLALSAWQCLYEWD